MKNARVSDIDEEDDRKFTIQARTKVPSLEKGMIYAECKENVDMWKHAMKDYMNEKEEKLLLSPAKSTTRMKKQIGTAQRGRKTSFFCFLCCSHELFSPF